MPVDLVRHRTLEQHDDHVARLFRHDRGLDVDEAFAAEPWRSDGDRIFIDHARDGAGLRHGTEDGARERHEVAAAVAQQHVAAGLEIILRRHVGQADAFVLVDDDERIGQRIDHGLAIGASAGCVPFQR